MNKNKFWVLTAAVIFLGICFRFWLLGQVPVSLYWDEQAIQLDAWSVATTGMDWHGQPWWQAIYASYGDFKLPIYIWFSSLAVKIFGIADWSVRLPSAVAGVLSVILAGLLIKDLIKLFNFKYDLSAKRMLVWTGVLVAATSFWSIHFSHVGFEGHLGQFLMSLSIWLLIRAWLWMRPQKLVNLFLNTGLASLTGALSILTYYSVRFVLPLIVVGSSILLGLVQKKIKPFQIISSVIVLGIIFGAIVFFDASPLALENAQIRLSTESVLSSNDHILRANQIQAKFNSSLLSRILYHRETFRVEQILKNMNAHLTPNFLYLSGDINLRHGTGEHGLMSIVLMPFGILGIWYLWKINKSLLMFLLGWWVLGLLPASIPQLVPHALRSLNAWLPMVILHAFGLFYVWQIKLRFWFWTVAGLLIISTFIFMYEYQTQYAIDSSSDFQQGYDQTAQYVASQQNTFTKIWVIPFDGRWFVWLLSAQNQPPTQQPELFRDEYQIFRVANVYLQTPTCDDVHFDQDLVVGRQHEVETFMDNCQITNPIYVNVTSHPKLTVVAITDKGK